MIDIRAVQGHTIALGRLGENNYTRILFDVSEWLAEYPQATIGLLNVRPGETIAYPVSPGNLSLDNGILYWTVTNSDLSAKGTGRCELVAYHGNTIMKSAIFKTMCLEALDGGATPPEPWESWQSFFQALADNAAQSASDAEAAVEHYPRINNGVWEVWDAQDGAFVSTGVQAQGPQGQPGQDGDPGADGTTFTPTVSAEGVISWTNDGGKPNPQPMNIKGPHGDDGTSPTVSVADITGGHRVTVTDANGTRSFDVMDGEDYVLTAADKAEIVQQAAENVDVPVQDVQVNGTSVVSDGVANVPKATTTQYGVSRYASSYGISASDIWDTPRIYKATDSGIKAGVQQYTPITPYNQHISTFYGLAKAAGADMASSSNPVGTYTDEAKIAIQKMLGIYEAPWELIREDTFTNASSDNYAITVDGNGQAFELTDFVLQIVIPKDYEVISTYSIIRAYYGEAVYLAGELGALSGTGTADKYGSVFFTKDGDGSFFSYTKYASSGTTRPINVRNADDFITGGKKINKIEFRAIQGKVNYKLYGKRKWQ